MEVIPTGVGLVACLVSFLGSKIGIIITTLTSKGYCGFNETNETVHEKYQHSAQYPVRSICDSNFHCLVYNNIQYVSYWLFPILSTSKKPFL